MTLYRSVEDMDITAREITAMLRKLGFHRDNRNGNWLYLGKDGCRGVWVDLSSKRALFTILENSNDNDRKMVLSFAIKLAKNFGGRLYNPHTNRYIPIKLTKEDKVRNIERMLKK